MATIVLGLCCLSSMIGGGYMAYNEIKSSQKKEENENRAAEIAQTPGLHMFSECDYKGVVLDVEDETEHSGEAGFKSFVLTGGYKLDTYNNVNLGGTRITFTGPQNISCSNRVIKSVKFYKA